MVLEIWRRHRIVVRKNTSGLAKEMMIEVWSTRNNEAKDELWFLRNAIEEIYEELNLKA